VAWRLRRGHRAEVDRLRLTTGRVIRIAESDVDGQRMFQPVVELVVGDNTYAITDTAYHDAATWRVGDSHPVYFDPAKPSDARLSRETGALFGAQLFGMFGIAFLAIGALALVAYAVGPDNALGAFVRDALA